MSADKMFEKLGYEKYNFGSVISYINDEGDEICFYLNSETFTIKDFCDGYQVLNMQERKAINKKCEELGWDV